MTPIVGTHDKFPILIMNPSHDSNCPTTDANILDTMYSSQVGQTRRVTVNDAGHAVFTSALIPDPGYVPMFEIFDNLLVDRTLPTNHLTTTQLQLPICDYRPRSVAPLSLDNVLSSLENDFVMLIEWGAYYNVIASCDNGGFVFWGNMINETHEAITFVDCAFTDPRYIVNGVAAYNWATPTLYTDGADFGFDMAAVTDTTTGATTYYNYLHLSNQSPSQTQLSLSVSRSIRTNTIDYSDMISNALKKLYTQ
jgi:hypothetical protein